MDWLVGTTGFAPPLSVSWSISLHEPFSGGTRSTSTVGNDGISKLGGPLKSVLVRSPTVDSRHFETFGTPMPNRALRNCSWEVWSKTSDAMWPLRLNGDIT